MGDLTMQILRQFPVNGDIISIAPTGEGHINKTFLVKTMSDEYILQEIAQNVFPNIDMLMSNINIVTQHLQKQGINTLEIVHTKDGQLYARDNGEAYRLFKFHNHSICYQSLSAYDDIEEVAAAFGHFHKHLSALEAAKLGEIIPFFHDTKKRYDDFVRACETNKMKRLESCQKEAEVIHRLSSYYGLIIDSLKEGTVKLHVTHNDPKINNVLFDETTKKVKCIIDLDTVMPGSVLYDFGDANRSLFTGSHEDDPNLDNIKLDLNIYRAYLRGYYKEAKDFLTKKEVELLPLAPFLLSIECGMRFLEDYLKGDVYFNTKYPEHNLIRGRTQIKLAELILSHQEKMKKITNEIIESFDNN